MARIPRAPALRSFSQRSVALRPVSVVALAAALAKLVAVRATLFGTPLAPGLVWDALFLLALATLMGSVGRTPRTAGTLVFSLVTSLAFLVTTVYARYYDEVPTLALLGFVGQARAETAGVASLVRVRDLAFIADLPLLCALAYRSCRHARPARPRAASRILVGVGLTVLGLALPPALTAVAPNDPRTAPRRIGLFAYQIVGPLAHLYAEQRVPSEIPELQRTIDRLTGRAPRGRVPGAPEPGAFAGAPVIVIQAEALQSGLIGARVAHQPVVPNLERFAAKSWYFPNMLSQIGKANTADAEFVANTSLYPALDRPSPVAYGTKVLPSLPRLLRARGYTTFTMHANDVRFWNRNQLYPALGFDRYYDKRFFGRREDTGHGTSDAVFFDKALPVLVAAHRNGPFYAQLVTVSAHYPFTNPFGHGTIRLPDAVARTETGRYLRLQSYADEALGRFLRALDENGLLDTAIVVIYGDHFGLRLDASNGPEEALRREIYGRPYNRADFYTVPLIVHLPGQREGRRVDHVVGQIDIMPTLADLLGLDLSGTPHFGRSAFVRTPTLLTKGGALDLYVDDEVIYMQLLDEEQPRAFSTRTHRPVPATRPARLDDARRLLALSAAYASSLPERTDDAGPIGYIPTERGGRDRSTRRPRGR